MFVEKNLILPLSVWDSAKRKVKITYNPKRSKFSIANRKENNFVGGFKVLNFHEKDYKNDFKICIDLRFYSTGSNFYACLWVDTAEISARGSARVGGYGYDKKSAAAAEAIINCGFSGFPRFSGSGDVIFGIENLLKFLNVKKYQIVEVYG